MKKVHTLIVGSGAAGLCAAIRLHAEGIDDLLIVTEGLDRGTSINTGSDKQTYYKLSLCGDQSDSPRQMARTYFDGASMHGDIALVEAALSARCFLHLVDLGVKFPTDAFGQFVGYKTDHDPRQRATSVGPYTSRDMCRALIRQVRERQIPVWEKTDCIELLKIKQDGRDRACGAILIDENGDIVPIIAENVVFAVGGPGGLYETSVYPRCHTGAIGLALRIGAEARNLPESQFGLASTKFRWNVSGTYMQVVPRFVSTDPDGQDEKEFLLEYFDKPGDLYSKIFLKGYQWPFDVRKVIQGSSILDLLVHIETIERGRRVFLDFRSNPRGFDFSELDEEARTYLDKSGALFGTPLERLERMNPGAIDLYADHDIDLRNEILEIAVCAQHNNGGLAGTTWWESTNIGHLFPVGEVNGSHGVARPGGSALNAGQVGTFRASEYIAHRYRDTTLDENLALRVAEAAVTRIHFGRIKPNDNTADDHELRHRMSRFGGAIRNSDLLETAVREAGGQLKTLDPLNALYSRCLAHVVYLDAILFAVRSGVGSRGSGMVLRSDGSPIHPKLDAQTWNLQPENESFREKVLLTRYDPETENIAHRWEPRRPIPEEELWFETEWRKYREEEIYKTH